MGSEIFFVSIFVTFNFPSTIQLRKLCCFIYDQSVIIDISDLGKHYCRLGPLSSSSSLSCPLHFLPILALANSFSLLVLFLLFPILFYTSSLSS